MDERKRADEAGPQDAELKQPDEVIKDLEPDKDEGENVKGGTYNLKFNLPL